MIAVSSHRPGCEIHWAAHKTWERAFDYCVYFGSPDSGLRGACTSFVPCDPFPSIRSLAAFCSLQPGWSAILNADIFLGDNFRAVSAYYISRGDRAQTSLRYQFEYVPGRPPSHGCIVDLGLDLFATTQEVWKRVCDEIPETFRIGHILWDTWMVGFFIAHCSGAIADLTPWQTVFHPKHEANKNRVAIQFAKKDKYLTMARWPLPRKEQQKAVYL